MQARPQRRRDRNLAIAGLARRARTLPLNADRRSALLSKARAVEHEDPGARWDRGTQAPPEALRTPVAFGAEILQRLIAAWVTQPGPHGLYRLAATGRSARLRRSAASRLAGRGDRRPTRTSRVSRSTASVRPARCALPRSVRKPRDSYNDVKSDHRWSPRFIPESCDRLNRVVLDPESNCIERIQNVVMSSDAQAVILTACLNPNNYQLNRAPGLVQ